jgi:hypothetical protein
MSVSKIELRAQIKLLRAQMNNLEVKSKEREDKLMGLVLILEPFLNALSPEIHKQIMETLDT